MKRLLAIATTVTLILGLSVSVNALNNNVRLGVWTNSEDESIAFWVEVSNKFLSPPVAVSSMIVTSPDETTFNMMDNFWWFEQDRGFYSGRKFAADFNGGVIPSGTYSVEVTDIFGVTQIATDQVTINFLDVPVITYPTDGSTIPNLNPVITWTPVAGAEAYRIHLWNDSWNEPIWWWREKRLYCSQTYFVMPPGVLYSGMRYKLQVQARDRLSDTDSRATSIWIYFNTP